VNDSDSRERRGRRFLERLKAADSQPGLIKAAAVARKALPGDEELGGERGDSLAREAGLTALQLWQSVSEAQGRGRGDVDLTILFTDLVDFSSWALEAGDEAVIELLGDVDDASQQAVTDHGGEVVKTLGDGMMAVFAEPRDGVEAAHAAMAAVGKLEHDGYTPRLRAGLHLGRPRRVRGDYLGVDVNVAARVAEAATAGELLASDAVIEAIGDDPGLDAKRKRRFKAKGAPKELEVYVVRAV
jgi:class 3 adenylate cyclase